MRTSRCQLFRSYYSKRATVTCLWQRLKGKQASRKALWKWEKGEDVRYTPVGDCCTGKAWGGLLQVQGLLSHWLGKHIWLSLGGLWSVQVRVKIGKLVVLDHVLTVLVQLLQAVVCVQTWVVIQCGHCPFVYSISQKNTGPLGCFILFFLP